MSDNFVYVGRKSCGCAVGIVTDDGDERTALHVAEFIRDGLTVSHASWKKYKSIAEEDTFMKCPHGQLKITLVGESPE